MGRKKIIDKGPRNIDLDILLYEDRVVDHPRLKLPHAGIAEREFVLRPLAEYVSIKHGNRYFQSATDFRTPDSFPISLYTRPTLGGLLKTI